MIKFLLLLLLIGYSWLMMRFSMGQSKRKLAENSSALKDANLGQLTKQLAQALDLPRIMVNVYEIEAINGLAAADGQIYLTRGFLAAKARGEVTDAELASVIAHELGHVALGHSRRRMIDFSGQNAVFMVLATVFNRFIPGLGGWIANLISGALMAHLSRRDEFEADAYAAALLVKAGIGVEPQVSLFEKLGKLTGGAGAGVPAWLMSHPKTGDRIAAIRVLGGRWGET
jgi:putative metalloprotease